VTLRRTPRCITVGPRQCEVAKLRILGQSFECLEHPIRINGGAEGIERADLDWRSVEISQQVAGADIYQAKKLGPSNNQPGHQPNRRHYEYNDFSEQWWAFLPSMEITGDSLPIH